MGSKWTSVIFALVISSGFFIHFTNGMGLCAFEEKFPGSSESCFKKKGTDMELSTADCNEQSTTRQSPTDKPTTIESSEPPTDLKDTTLTTDEWNEPTTDMKTTTDPCPRNMVPGICVCLLATCEEPKGLVGCHTHCPPETGGCTCPEGFMMHGDDCVFPAECPCYWPEGEMVIPEGKTYVSTNCTRKAACSKEQLVRNEEYQCSTDAVCEERNGERNCYCKDGFRGDGVTCNSTKPLPTDCMDVYVNVSTDSGTYNIKPSNWDGPAFPVYWNMSDGGGWTVFQRRTDGSVYFFLGWWDYKNGFGNVNGEHWLGNDKLHSLTNQTRYRIRIDLVNRNHDQYYGAYDFFRIENEAALYRMSGLGTYTGNVDERSNSDGGYLLTYYRNGQFSTKDRDNDRCSSQNLADYRKSAWWYGSIDCTSHYTINGRYSDTFHLPFLPGRNDLYFSEMKIRPV